MKYISYPNLGFIDNRIDKGIGINSEVELPDDIKVEKIDQDEKVNIDELVEINAIVVDYIGGKEEVKLPAGGPGAITVDFIGSTDEIELPGDIKAGKIDNSSEIISITRTPEVDDRCSECHDLWTSCDECNARHADRTEGRFQRFLKNRRNNNE